MPNPIRAHLSLLLVLLVCAAGALLLWYSTAWGVGVSPDSAEYIAAARRLKGPADLFTLPTQWAPGYPVLLSLAYLWGDDVFALTRVLQCVLMAGNVWMGTALLRHVLGRESLLPALGAAVLVVGFNLWQVAFYAWSEGPFLLCLQGSALALLHYVESGNRKPFVVTVLLAALALMFRYAGLAWVGAAALTLLLLGTGCWRSRLGDALLFGMTSVVPFALWLLANQLVRQETTNREFVVHLINGNDLLILAGQFASWLGWQQGIALFIAEAALVIGIWYQVRHSSALNLRCRQFLGLTAVHVGVYTVFILFSKSFLDAYIPFDSRIFAPAWIFALLALLVCALPVVRLPIGAMALVAVAGGNIAALVPTIIETHTYGMGYLSSYMASVSDVRSVPVLNTVTVYSNGPDYLRMSTDFTVRDYPQKFNPTTQLANPRYQAELAAIAEDVRAGTALLVHYRVFEMRTYYPRMSELEQLGYRDMLRGREVVLLGFLPEPTPSPVDVRPL